MAENGVTLGGVRDLGGSELVTLCRDAAEEINKLQALLAAASNQIWEASEGHAGQDKLTKAYGCRSTVELVQRVTGEPASVVSARLKVGRQVAARQSLVGEELVPLQEHVAGGLESGRLNMNAAVHICKVLVKNNRSHPEDLEMAQRCLVQAATGVDFGTGDKPGMPLHADEVRRLCVAWDAGLDPDGVAPSEEERDRKRFFNVGPIRDGMARVNGLVKAEVAAMFTTIMDTVNNPKVKTDGLPYLNNTNNHGDDNQQGDDTSDANQQVDGNGDQWAEGNGDQWVEGNNQQADGNGQAEGGDSDDAGLFVVGDVVEHAVGAAQGGLFPVEDAGEVAVGVDPTDNRSWAQRRHDVLAMALGVTLADVDLPILQGAGATIVVEINENSLTNTNHNPNSASDPNNPHTDCADGSDSAGDSSGSNGHSGSNNPNNPGDPDTDCADGSDGSSGSEGGNSSHSGAWSAGSTTGGGARSSANGFGVGWLVDHEGASTPISASVVHQMGCNGNVQAVVRNSLGKIVSLGSPQRLFTPVQRRGIALRDGGCVIPGCSVPSAWCEVHHVQPHAEGGPTHTDNGVILCRYHHSTIDSSGWVITMHAGIPYVHPPEWLVRMHSLGLDQGWVNYAMNTQVRRIQETLARHKHRRTRWQTEKPPRWDQYT